MKKTKILLLILILTGLNYCAQEISKEKMFDNKIIVFVGPEQYSDLCRISVHEISKMENLASVYWTIGHYKANEFKNAPDFFYRESRRK
jgi:hypothetical protein